MDTQGVKSRVKKPYKYYSESFKRMVVQEYETGKLNKDAIQVKYGIGGNSRVLTWCRKYGKLHYSELTIEKGRPMKDPQKKRIKELEAQLRDAELKVLAYQKIIEVAEREEGISILKKDEAKQLKSLHNSIREK